MDRILEYNDMKVDWVSTEEHKKRIKKFWGDRFIKFTNCRGKYISYLVRW